MTVTAEELAKKYARNNTSFKLLQGRIGAIAPHNEFEPGSIPGVDDLAGTLNFNGGLTQQVRMIRDKRRSLDRAVLYSYQGAVIRKYIENPNEAMEGDDDEFKALINPNKLKPDYDDKVLSVGFEANVHCGDIIEWTNTGTFWLVYQQNTTELAYFRGDMRKCSYAISYTDENGNIRKTYAAVRGPVETRLSTWQKNGVEYNSPNYSLNLIIPKNQNTLKYFQRYAKFYLSNGVQNVCWRVEAVDSFRIDGVIEFTAVEYYANEDKDTSTGIVDGNVPNGEIINPTLLMTMATPDEEIGMVVGESTIKAKRSYTYFFEGESENGSWHYESKGPLVVKTFEDEEHRPAITIKWSQTYGGTITLWYGNKEDENAAYKKNITVTSLF